MNYNEIQQNIQQDNSWDGGQPMSQEEMIADLKNLMDKIHASYGRYNSTKNESERISEGSREESMNKVFEILAAAGVDGSDPQQVSEFLAQIEKNSPELYQLFSESIASLIGPEEPQGEEGMQPNVEPVEEMGQQM